MRIWARGRSRRRRAYAYDLLNFLRFLAGRNAGLAGVVATDLFDYPAWQQRPVSTAGQLQATHRSCDLTFLSCAVVNSIEAHARADIVFDFMTDVRNEPNWNPQMLRVEKPTPGEIGRGTRFRVRFGRGVGETIIENVTFDRFRSWTAVSRSRLLDVEAEGREVDALSGCRLIM